MIKTILVTGSFGFLGEYVCEEVINSGYKLKKFDISSGQDILNSQQLEAELFDCDVCIHLAAVADLYEADSNPEHCKRVNIEGTRNVAEACKKFGIRLLYASTCCAYGNNGIAVSDENSPCMPTELYAETKLQGEKLIENTGGQYTFLRLATFYGPNMRSTLATSIFLNKNLSGETIYIHGNGNQTRCYTHVSDVAKGIMTVLNTKNSPQIVNISDDRGYSVNELIDIINRVTGKQSDTVNVDDRNGQITSSIINSDLLQSFGWKPKWDIYTGLLNCIDEVKAQLEVVNC